MKRIVGLMCIATLLLSGSARDANAAEDIRTQIEAANRTFEAAFAKGDAAGVAACYTADAQILPPGSRPLTGTAAIAGYWGQGMQGGIKSFKLTTLEIEQHGETAIEVGSAEVVGEAGAVVDTANYIVIWKLVDGKWKLHRDIWNSNAAAQ